MIQPCQRTRGPTSPNEAARSFRGPGELNRPSYADNHEDKARRLARYLQSLITHHPDNDSYSWPYVDAGRMEDTGHASLVVRFVALAHREGVVFTELDMQRFLNTFRYLTTRAERVRSHLDQGDPRDPELNSKWQQAAARWLDLTPFHWQVYRRARDIFYNHGGETPLGAILLRKWRAGDHIYPISAAQVSSQLEAYAPAYALGERNATGLYRPADRALEYFGDTPVSSCAKYTFEDPHSVPLTVTYRHTAQMIAGDSCGGWCGSSPGLQVLYGLDGQSWTQVKGVPTPLPENFQSSTLDIPTPYQHILLCRGRWVTGRRTAAPPRCRR